MASNFWSRISRATNIVESVSPLMFASFLSGLTPLQINRGKYPNSNRYRFLIITFYLGLYIPSYIMCFRTKETIVGYFFQTDISTVGDSLQLLIGPTTIGVIVISSILNRKYYSAAFDLLAITDDKLISLGAKINYTQMLRKSYMIMGLFLLTTNLYLTGCYFLLKSAGVNPTFYVYVSFTIPHCFMVIVIFMFKCSTKITGFRFTYLNKVIKKMIEGKQIHRQQEFKTGFENWKSEKITVVSVGKLLHLDMIKEVAEIHNNLTDVCSCAEKYFTYQLLSITGIAFVVVLFNGYYVLELVINGGGSINTTGGTEFITFMLTQMILYISLLFACITGAANVTNENQEIAVNTHKLLNQTEDESIRERLMCFSMQLVHRKVVFTAAGIFNIDRTLVFTMSGAATTYLIILLQFSTSAFQANAERVCMAANASELHSPPL